MRKNHQDRFRIRTAVVAFFAVGFLSVSNSFPSPPSTDSPEAAPSSPIAFHNLVSWNFFECAMSGRWMFSGEQVFRIAGRSVGLNALYSSRPNVACKGVLTGYNKGKSSGDAYEFFSGVEFFIHYYGKPQSRGMRYFPRIGLSFVQAPEEEGGATYLSAGPGVRAFYGKNFHLFLSLSTVKFKISGNAKYSPFLMNLFSVMVGFNI